MTRVAISGDGVNFKAKPELRRVRIFERLNIVYALRHINAGLFNRSKTVEAGSKSRPNGIRGKNATIAL